MKAGAKERRSGFTLIELLLVISIILLLITILAVAVNPKSGPAAAIQRMNSLSAALEAWRNVYGVYPPSSSQGHGGAPQYGAQCLYYYLKGPKGLGWAVGDNMPGVIGTVSAEYTWQGAMNVGVDWVTTPQGQYNGQPYFNDGIQGGDRAILYYRAAWLVNQAQSGASGGQPLVSTTNSIGLYNYYNFNDNCDSGATYQSDSPFWPGSGPNSPGTTPNPSGYSKQQQWENEITDVYKTEASAGQVAYTTPAAQRFPQRPMTYILISAGTDREFGMPSDPSRGWASDDITNYTP